jgi:tetratricopeptide (TPR) repeat protein
MIRPIVSETILYRVEETYGPHRNIEVAMGKRGIAKRILMRRVIQIGVVLGCCLSTAAVLGGQSVPSSNSQENKPPASSQQAPAQKPKDSNPFPEDTSNIPVVPTTAGPNAAPPPPSAPDSGVTSLLHEDTDPIKSPDDPVAGSGSDSGFSSSLQGANDVRIPDEPEKPKRRQKLEPPPHQETAKDDESVGAYYLDQKNWKAALSRFQSALVLDPENPDVYWGMAEAQRQLGEFASSKANYLKVMEYDPDSKHGKEAKKFLKQPEIANAPSVSANQPAKPQQ